MKKLTSLILALTACLSLFAQATDNKMLVVYFSRAGENWHVGVVERGNTAVMVDYIQEFADVDVFEVKPVVPYPEGYQDCIEYVTDEINRNDRPAYVGDITNINDYDVVFIGGPIWWARPPHDPAHVHRSPSRVGRQTPCTLRHPRRQWREQLHLITQRVFPRCQHT